MQMTRRKFLAALGAGAAAAMLPATGRAAANAPANRPNILMVLIDDMGWGDFSCFGNKEARTPNIDRLAAEGLSFHQFYVNMPICSPSRTALSTAQYPQRWRISSYLDNRAVNDARGVAQWLDPKAPMVARALHEAGYATGHFGKWHMGGQRDVGEAPLITEYGFDASLTNFEGLGPRVLPLLNAYDGKEPVKYALGSDTLDRGPITWIERSKVVSAYVARALEFIKEAEASGKPFYINLWPDDVHSPFFPPKERRGDGSKRALYLGALVTMDEQLGPLFDAIRSSEKLRDNTLILVCSDNGPEDGAGSAGPFRGNKAMLYEGGIRSPLVAWGPGLIDPAKAGAVNKKSFFAAIDLARTMYEITGVQPPAGAELDGVPMRDVVLGKSEASRGKPLFFRRPPDRDEIFGVSALPDLAVRDGNWKLLCEYDGSRAQLYDLDADPGEKNNVADAQPEIVKRLKPMLLAWHQAMPPDKGATYVAPKAKNAAKGKGAPKGKKGKKKQ